MGPNAQKLQYLRTNQCASNWLLAPAKIWNPEFPTTNWNAHSRMPSFPGVCFAEKNYYKHVNQAQFNLLTSSCGQMTWLSSLKPSVARSALQSELFAWCNPYSLKNTMTNRMTEKNTHIGRPTFSWWSRWSWWSRRTRRPGRPRSPWISLQNSSKKERIGCQMERKNADPYNPTEGLYLGYARI